MSSEPGKNLSVSEGMGRGISEYGGRKEGWEKRSEDEMDKTAKKWRRLFK